MSTRRQTLRYLWRHLKAHPLLSFLAFVGTPMGVAFSLVNTVIFKDFVNLLAYQAEDPQILQQVFWLIGLYVLCDVLSVTGWRITSYAACYLQPKVMQDIGAECFEAVHGHSFDFFANSFVGSLVKKVNRMVRAFEDLTDSLFFQIGPMLTNVFGIGAVLFVLSPWMGLAVFAWVLLYLGAQFYLSIYKMKRYDIPKAQADSAVSGYLADTMSNHVAVQLFARRGFEKKGYGKVTEDWRQKQMRSWFFDANVETVQAVLMILLNLAILWMALGLWQSGELTVGYFFLIQTYLTKLFTEFWGMGRMIRHLYEHFADANEMMEILLLQPEVKDELGSKSLKIKRGEIRFNEVSFSYRGDMGKEALRALNLRVKPGERVALIGPSGGGKTTFVKLLLRLFDVNKGSIEIDGQNTAKVKQDSLRSQIALVPQDPVLFHRSLMENIRYGRLNASDKEVLKASKLAHCHEFIARLPEGYNTFVGERGVKLSGGERQRVAIARAILANTRILVLDEATSSLDSESEKKIKDALDRLMKGRTVFVIAHRLSTVMDMDRIVVLEKGKIVEEGTHDELLSKASSLYKRLWELQVGAYLE